MCHELFCLSDEQFALVEKILQRESSGRGRKPAVSDRQVLEGVLYILRRGLQWRAMPAEFGPWMTVFMRYKSWIERGVWWKILMCLQRSGALRINLTFYTDGEERIHGYPGHMAPE